MMNPLIFSAFYSLQMISFHCIETSSVLLGMLKEHSLFRTRYENEDGEKLKAETSKQREHHKNKRN